MRKQSAFLSRQLVRFGMMTLDQILKACSGRCKRATVYRILKSHRQAGFINKPYNVVIQHNAFSATRKLYAQVLPKSVCRGTSIPDRKAEHALAVVETLLTLSRYSFVTLVATEHEIDQNSFKQFCHSKIPDALIQISNGDEVFELAVEVEWSPKSDLQIDELLEKYRATFVKELICAGVLIVTKNKRMLELYQEKIKKLSEEFEKRILVVNFDELESLETKHFGTLNVHPGNALEKTAIFSQGTIHAEPLITKDFLPKGSALSPT